MESQQQMRRLMTESDKITRHKVGLGAKRQRRQPMSCQLRPLSYNVAVTCLYMLHVALPFKYLHNYIISGLWQLS